MIKKLFFGYLTLKNLLFWPSHMKLPCNFFYVLCYQKTTLDNKFIDWLYKINVTTIVTSTNFVKTNCNTDKKVTF